MKVLRIDTNSKKVSFSFSLEEIMELSDSLGCNSEEDMSINEKINRDLHTNLNKVISFFDEVKK